MTSPIHPLKRSSELDPMPTIELPPTIIPSINAARTSQSISIVRFTWSCHHCRKIIDVTDDDIVSMSDRVRYCAACIDKRKDIPRRPLINRYVDRVIQEEIDKKKDEI